MVWIDEDYDLIVEKFVVVYVGWWFEYIGSYGKVILLIFGIIGIFKGVRYFGGGIGILKVILDCMLWWVEEVIVIVVLMFYVWGFL